MYKMKFPTHLDGAEVLKTTTNDTSRKLSSVIFEEEDGTTNEVFITALAIIKYKDDDRYYLFLCDCNWEVVNDFLLDTMSEAMNCARMNFSVNSNDWITLID